MTKQKQYIAALACGTGAEGLRVRQELQDWAERQGMSLSGLVKGLAEFDVQLEDVQILEDLAERRDVGLSDLIVELVDFIDTLDELEAQEGEE